MCSLDMLSWQVSPQVGPTTADVTLVEPTHADVASGARGGVHNADVALVGSTDGDVVYGTHI